MPLLLDLNVGLPLIEQVELDLAAPTPVLDAPYTWSVAKNGDAISFEGDVPTDGLRRYLLVRAGEGAGDGMDVRPDAPDGFVDQVLAGMDPLLQSDEARISFRDGKWVFTGLADDQESLDALSRQLEANAHTRDWTRILSVRPVTLSAMKANGGPVELNGLLPAASLRSYLQVISGNGNVDNVRIGGQAAPDFVNAAIAGVRALNNLETGELSFNGAHWNLTGQSLTNLDAESAKSLVAALPAGKSWTIDIRQAPLFDICSRAVTAFSDSHQILFAPASARIESESRSQLGDLADELLKCPDADLYVEGHTDSDGPADANMALSVARAEAVIEELIGLGISYTRLYAIGYGETLPIASNETRQGKAQNRRIVFELIKQQ
ncbi:MAG: OmpA family protein [Hyphomicrobiaceae bacterium]|nr:OmpA family protein [Hyphomicrobiaceae bacterium]